MTDDDFSKYKYIHERVNEIFYVSYSSKHGYETHIYNKQAKYEEFIEHRDSSGIFRSSMEMRNAKRDGETIFVNADGSSVVKNYRQNKLNGVQKRLDENGNLTNVRLFMDGKDVTVMGEMIIDFAKTKSLMEEQKNMRAINYKM